MKCQKCTFSIWDKVSEKLLCTFNKFHYLCEKENYDGKCPNFKVITIIRTLLNYIKK